MLQKFVITLAFGVALATVAVPVAAQPVATGGTVFVTLGTMGGPVADGQRSQPANALIVGDELYLVDAGDGTVEQLAKAKLPLPKVRAVFLSHLHADHTGGLSAVLALRNQTLTPSKLTVYGPRGTQEMVAGMIASMGPAARAGYGIPGKPWPDPASGVEVVEMPDGFTGKVGGMSVRAVKNTHYDFAPGSDEDRLYQSLSLRFEAPDRTIVYTGDTGPSAAVEALAAGADLLVSELIDIDATLAIVSRNSPNMPEKAKVDLVRHLSTHHLTPADVGKLAKRARVKELAVTHFAGGTASADQVAAIAKAICAEFGGKVAIANDLDKF